MEKVVCIKTKQAVNASDVQQKFPAVYQTLTESEARWGTRPDGFLVALSAAAFRARAKDIMDACSYEEYTRVDGDPIPCFVTAETYKAMAEGNGSLWLHISQNDKSWMVQ